MMACSLVRIQWRQKAEKEVRAPKQASILWAIAGLLLINEVCKVRPETRDPLGALLRECRWKMCRKRQG